MNKADLKKWSKYCDTDKLANDTMSLLKKYGYGYTEHGVCTLLDVYFKQKEPLIKLFTTSNHYIGDMRISLKKEFDRQIDRNEIYRFFDTFHDAINSSQLVKNQDNNGKVMFDYLTTGNLIVNIDGLPKEKEQEQMLTKMRAFDYRYQTTVESQKVYDEFCEYIQYFYRLCQCSIPNDWCANQNAPMLKKGTKTSRAFNAVCSHYGVDKFNPKTETVEKDGQLFERITYPYNKLFAEYSDLVSSLKRKMNFIISLNPLDYLTMSFGVNWISCHNIQSGGWKNGCLSYMLDSTSMVTFVVNNTDDQPIHEIPKVYRQMYHYENGLFIQNRLYPQGNDGATNLYDKFREFIVEEFSDTLNIECGWEVKTGVDTCCSHIKSMGSHYKDYRSRGDCSIFYPVSKAKDVSNHVMTIGHNGICVKCGKTQTENSRLNHRFLSDCNAAGEVVI